MPDVLTQDDLFDYQIKCALRRWIRVFGPMSQEDAAVRLDTEQDRQELGNCLATLADDCCDLEALLAEEFR